MPNLFWQPRAEMPNAQRITDLVLGFAGFGLSQHGFLLGSCFEQHEGSTDSSLAISSASSRATASTRTWGSSCPCSRVQERRSRAEKQQQLRQQSVAFMQPQDRCSQ